MSWIEIAPKAKAGRVPNRFSTIALKGPHIIVRLNVATLEALGVAAGCCMLVYCRIGTDADRLRLVNGGARGFKLRDIKKNPAFGAILKFPRFAGLRGPETAKPAIIHLAMIEGGLEGDIPSFAPVVESPPRAEPVKAQPPAPAKPAIAKHAMVGGPRFEDVKLPTRPAFKAPGLLEKPPQAKRTA